MDDLHVANVPDEAEPLLELEPEDNQAVVPRLDILSLKRVLDLAKEEFIGIDIYRHREDDEIKSKAEVIWKLSCKVIKEQDVCASEVIELMETLVYFGSDRLNSNIFNIDENALDEKSAKVKILLSTLEYYGLIDVYPVLDSWDTQNTIMLHSPLLAMVILEKTEPIKLHVLKNCFILLGNPKIWHPHFQAVYLTVVWEEALKHTELVKKYKSDGIELCKKVYNSPPTFMDKKGLVAKTSRKFRSIFSLTDPAIIWIECVELEAFITVMENVDIHSSEIEILLVLYKSQKCRNTIDQYTKSRGGRKDILEIFERIADKIFIMSTRSSEEFESRLLEESHEFYKLLHSRRRNIFDYGKFFLGTLRCLKGLHKTSEILDLLREIRKIIQSKKSKMDKMLGDDYYYYYLHCIPKAALDLKIVDFSYYTGGVDGLEKSILEELIIILKFGYTYLSQHLRHGDEVVLGSYFAETMLILVMCLIKLEKTEELLLIIQQAHESWKSVLIDFHYYDDTYYDGQESAKLITNKYLRILSLIFEMAVLKKEVKLMKTLLWIGKDLCLHTLRSCVYRDFPSEDTTLFLVIQCCLELNRTEGLINYSKEYEKLVRSKFESNLIPIAQAMIAFGEKQVKFLKPVANRAKYFPLLKSIMSNAKTYGKIISEDLYNMNLETIKTAKESIEFCEYRLSSETVAVDDSWSWGTEWYKSEKQEIESAKKLFL